MTTPVSETNTAYEYTKMVNSTHIEALLNDSGRGCGHDVHDMKFNKDVRMTILYLTIGLNIIGSILVVMWITCKHLSSRKSKPFSRVNSLMLNLTVADLLVVLLAVTPQLLWEYADREWAVGPVMCRLVKLLQSFSITSSNYMLVVIAIDRHQAIWSPMKKTFSVWKMAAAGWIMAVLVNSPIVGLFHTNEVDGQMKCENVFRGKPKWHRQLWLTYIMLAVFVMPLIILAICYIRIALKMSNKVRQNSVKRKDKIAPGGKIPLQSTHSNSLPIAKRKTLQMTFVIILAFIICSFPYCIVEMIMSFGDHCIISPELTALLGGMAAFNSAANPYIFLIFNVKFESFRISRRGLNRSTSKISFLSSLSPAFSFRRPRNPHQIRRQNTEETQV